VSAPRHAGSEAPARHWSTQPSKTADIEALVDLTRGRATSDIAYLALEVWFDGPLRRFWLLVPHRPSKTPNAKRQTPNAEVRTPSHVELRPAQDQHAYRYQLHRQRQSLPKP